MLSKIGNAVCDGVEQACRRVKPNGCTLAPDHNFRSCCDAHDEAYTLQKVSRLEADMQLRDCITAAGHPLKAQVYYAGVRAFGWVFWLRKKAQNDRLETLQDEEGRGPTP